MRLCMQQTTWITSLAVTGLMCLAVFMTPPATASGPGQLVAVPFAPRSSVFARPAPAPAGPAGTTLAPESVQPPIEDVGTSGFDCCGNVSVRLYPDYFDFTMSDGIVPGPKTVCGQIKGNFHSYKLGIVIPCGEQDFVLPPTSGQVAEPVPVSWKMRYRADSCWTAWREPYAITPGCDGQLVAWWRLCGCRHVTTFQLRSAVHPDPTHPAGEYAEQFSIIVQPQWGW